MDRVPFAASVRNPGPEPDRVESFDMGGAEDPMEFPLSDADEEARQVRLSAPRAPKLEVSAEERGRLIAGCADAVLALSPLIHGAGDALVRRLAEEVGITVEEADALVADEIARRRTAK